MRIYLFRGLLGNFFSTGMGRLAWKLNAAGHNATVHSWINRKSVEKKARNYSGAVGFVGHSLGGNSANYSALNLQTEGCDVRALVCIDATAPKDIFGIEGFSFCSRDRRAKHVKGLTQHTMPKLNHIQIDKDDEVHRLTLNLFSDVTCL